MIVSEANRWQRGRRLIGWMDGTMTSIPDGSAAMVTRPCKGFTERAGAALVITLAMVMVISAGSGAGAQTADTRPGSAAGVPLPAPVESAPLAPPPGAPQAPSPVAPSLAAPAPAPPSAAEAGPVPAPAQSPAPAPAPQLAQPPAAAPSPSPSVNPDATLAGKPGDTTDVDTLVLTARPALTMAGQTTWDKGLGTLAEVFEKLRGEAGKLGLQVAGRPLTHFIETDDIGFRYEAMLPVDRPPGTTPPGDVRSGTTPEGRALRFTHKAPYDDIDTTYESITAYLDAKGLTVRDQFIEEYVGDPRKGDDPNFEINVYVLPR
jgi:effector-binding domain-containing protein